MYWTAFNHQSPFSSKFDPTAYNYCVKKFLYIQFWTFCTSLLLTAVHRNSYFKTFFSSIVICCFLNSFFFLYRCYYAVYYVTSNFSYQEWKKKTDAKNNQIEEWHMRTKIAMATWNYERVRRKKKQQQRDGKVKYDWTFCHSVLFPLCLHSLFYFLSRVVFFFPHLHGMCLETGV